jgi:hypothetical protein
VINLDDKCIRVACDLEILGDGWKVINDRGRVVRRFARFEHAIEACHERRDGEWHALISSEDFHALKIAQENA